MASRYGSLALPHGPGVANGMRDTAPPGRAGHGCLAHPAAVARRPRRIRAEMQTIATASFQWRDGERTIHFGRDALKRALPSLGDGYVLLTTSRALSMAPSLADRAAVVYSIKSGSVDELAGELLGDIEGELVVALGGGRV